MKNFLLFAILTTILFCAAICNAQVREPQIELTERLPDGSIILTIDGVKYRALTAEQIRKVMLMSVSFESCVKENETLTGQNQTLKAAIEKVTQDLAVAGEQINVERNYGDEYKQLYEAERELRLQAEKLPEQKNIIEKALSQLRKLIARIVKGIASKQ